MFQNLALCQGTTLQAAEKGLDLTRTREKHPAGPKGHADFAALTARLYMLRRNA
jgi:hypothetical protein